MVTTVDLRTDLRARVEALDWPSLIAEINEYGCALSAPVLTPDECQSVADLYDEAEHFRSTIDMARYRFGQGQYRYFDNPIPEFVAGLRAALYTRLVPIARNWAEKLKQPSPWPDTFGEFLLVEQRPRAQSRGTATTLRQGCAMVFTTRDRPVPSSRGWSASPVRHGVSAIRSGQRHTLGLVFHDAR